MGTLAEYLPLIFQPNEETENQVVEGLDTGKSLTRTDRLKEQIMELIVCRNPALHAAGDTAGLQRKFDAFCAELDLDSYGNWVYYPWSGELIRVLPEKEFIEVRTNRNKHKITDEEQSELSGKIVGIVGLSVGQSVATAIATERIAGELRLADFDTIELSNLNRLRTGLRNLGLNKAISVAREIAEIDPYMKVKIFTDGLTEQNLDEFFHDEQSIDLLVEECDDLRMKIIARLHARKSGIPVIMEANDRCLVDIERFDLEPNRPLLHGIVSDADADKILKISDPGEAMMHILRIVDVDHLSPKVKASIVEIGSSLGTWPQLASSVAMGGGVSADLVRQILLNNFTTSGRYQIDIDKVFGIPSPGSETQQRNSMHDQEEIDVLAGQANKQLPARTKSVHEIEEIIGSSAEFKKTLDQLFDWRILDDRLFIFYRYSGELRSEDRFRDRLAVAGFMAGWLDQLSETTKVEIQLNPLGTDKPLLAVISTSDQSAGGVSDEAADLLRSELTDQVREALADEILFAITHGSGTYRLSGFLNPSIAVVDSGNPQDLMLRLVNQPGVIEYLKQWKKFDGVKNILRAKLSKLDEIGLLQISGDAISEGYNLHDLQARERARGRNVIPLAWFSTPDLVEDMSVLAGLNGKTDDRLKTHLVIRNSFTGAPEGANGLLVGFADAETSNEIKITGTDAADRS